MDETDDGRPPGQNGADQPDFLTALRNVRTHEALARFAGNKERYRHWLNDFITHGPAAVGQIQQSIASGSLDAATNLVHGLKGRTGMLGMSELHSITISLENALKKRDPIRLWLDELSRTVDEMSKEIADAMKRTLP